MNAAVNPELAQALARIAELEAELAEDDRIHRRDQALIDGYEEAVEALETEIVAERAKVLETQKRAEAWEEEYRAAERAVSSARDALRDMILTKEELEVELKGAEANLRDLEEEHEALKEAGAEEIGSLRDLLIDYLLSIGEPVQSLHRTSRELQALCDALL